jgi:hypothetical protein
MVDHFPHILLNRRFYSHFRTLASSTRSMVLMLSPQSTMDISFRTSALSSSAFLWSSRYGATHPLSDQRPRFTSIFSPPPCPKTSKVVDLTQYVLLDDGRSQITSGLQDFDNSTTPVHTRVNSCALTSRSSGCWSFVLRPNKWDLFLSSALPLFYWTLI